METDLRGQESELIDHIVNQYADRLLRAAVLILGDYHLAEDIVQETLIDAATHLSSFRGESALYTWLYRILIRRCRRQQNRRFWNMLKFVPRSTLDHLSNRNSPVPTEQVEEKMEITAALQQLPEIYREIIALYYYEEFTTVEIAAILAVPQGTVKNRLYRARQKLSQFVREEEGDEFQAEVTS